MDVGLSNSLASDVGLSNSFASGVADFEPRLRRMRKKIPPMRATPAREPPTAPPMVPPETPLLGSGDGDAVLGVLPSEEAVGVCVDVEDRDD